VSEEIVLPSGKGVNAAFGVHTLGGQSICTGFLGGLPGKFHEAMMRESGIPSDWTWVDGNTRTAVAVIDRSEPGRDATLISELGPHISNGKWKELHKNVLATSCDIAAVCGGMPPVFPPGELKAVIEDLKKKNVKTWVDTSRDGLGPCLEAVPFGLKINASEAGSISGITVKNSESAVKAAEALIKKGLEIVIITLGEHGAVLVSPETRWTAQPPGIQAVSSVGSGDAFLAGFLYGFSQNGLMDECLCMGTAAGSANSLIMGGGRFSLRDYEIILKEIKIKKI